MKPEIMLAPYQTVPTNSHHHNDFLVVFPRLEPEPEGAQTLQLPAPPPQPPIRESRVPLARPNPTA